MKSNPLKVLEVSASARGAESASRALSRNLIDALDDRYGNVRIVRRASAKPGLRQTSRRTRRGPASTARHSRFPIRSSRS